MGLQIIKPDTRIDFIGFRKIAYMVSAALILLGVASLLIKGGPKYGIDFAGGIVVQVKFDHSTTVADLDNVLKDASLPGLVVQQMGMDDDNEFLVRTSSSDISSAEVREKLNASFSKLSDRNFDIQRLEMVGPKVGSDLRSQAMEALFFAVLLIAIYISGRFEQKWMISGIMAAVLFGTVYFLGQFNVATGWLIVVAMIVTIGLCWYLKLDYALGAVVALIHDVTITIGLFSVMNKEFDLTVIAALLTIIGYSLNDTIIVFDRIRENLREAKAGESFARVINDSINQTLGRTIMTSFTTLLVVIALFVLGGGVIHDFALALLIGIGVGTYSSIFVASPILLGFGPDKVQPEKPAEVKTA